MTVELLVALIGTGTVTAVVTKVLDLLFGRGKRERAEFSLRRMWETVAVQRHALALRLFVLAVEAGAVDVPEVPPLPDLSES